MFPLADWVLGHPDVPHNLAVSGMKDALRSLPGILRSRPEADPQALRRELARLHGVPSSRLFVTHGATEANALVLLFLARRLLARGAKPRCFVPTPEYPPLTDAAAALGFEVTHTPAEAEAAVLSSPRNPSGLRVAFEELDRLADRDRPILVDQTFREFTEEPSALRSGIPDLWISGSFTKIYGADDLRVGYAIAPEADSVEFARLHGLLLDRLPPGSVSGALAILANRARLLQEARGIFRTNLAYLRRRIEGVPSLAAPVWLDHGPRGLEGDRLARRLLRAGILVCSGSFFGDPRGVRIALTRRSFPADLEQYLRYRDGR